MFSGKLLLISKSLYEKAEKSFYFCEFVDATTYNKITVIVPNEKAKKLEVNKEYQVTINLFKADNNLFKVSLKDIN
jgi:hypothetical protein